MKKKERENKIEGKMQGKKRGQKCDYICKSLCKTLRSHELKSLWLRSLLSTPCIYAVGFIHICKVSWFGSSTQRPNTHCIQWIATIIQLFFNIETFSFFRWHRCHVAGGNLSEKNSIFFFSFTGFILITMNFISISTISTSIYCRHGYYSIQDWKKQQQQQQLGAFTETSSQINRWRALFRPLKLMWISNFYRIRDITLKSYWYFW